MTSNIGSGVPWAARAAILMWLAAIAVLAVTGFFLIVVLGLDALTATGVGEGVAIIPIIVYLRRRRIPISTLGLRGGRVGRVIGLSVLLGFAALGLSAVWGIALTALVPGYEDYLRTLPTVSPSSLPELVRWMVVVLVFVGPMEEILSRGFVQRGMESRFGTLGGLLVASLLFGAIHFEPAAAANAFVLGLLLGFVYQRTRYNLWVPIGMHVIFDWVALAIRFFFLPSA